MSIYAKAVFFNWKYSPRSYIFIYIPFEQLTPWDYIFLYMPFGKLTPWGYIVLYMPFGKLTPWGYLFSPLSRISQHFLFEPPKTLPSPFSLWNIPKENPFGLGQKPPPLEHDASLKWNPFLLYTLNLAPLTYIFNYISFEKIAPWGYISYTFPLEKLTPGANWWVYMQRQFFSIENIAPGALFSYIFPLKN